MSDRAPLLDISEPDAAAFLICGLNSFVLDFTARVAVGGTDLSYFIIKQLPMLSPASLSRAASHSKSTLACILPRVLELCFTAWDLESFAWDCGYDGPPFIWNEERRFLIRCELDAAFFHLYLPATANGEWRMASREDGAVVDETPEQLAALKEHFPTPRDAVAYIMDTFPIVKRKDEAAHGHYRTKDTILEIYDEMAAVIAENEAARTAGRQPTARYQTRLDPPPGPPTDAEGNFIPMSQWDPTNWPPHIHRPPQREDSHAV